MKRREQFLGVEGLPALTDDISYKAALDKLQQVRGQRNTVQAELDSASEKHRLGRDDGRASVKAEANTYLDSGVIPAVPASPVGRPIAVLRRELAILEEAERQQVSVVEAERRRAGAAIRESVLPAHRQAAGKIKAALETLLSAMEVERGIVEELSRGDVPFVHPLRAITFCFGGDLEAQFQERQSREEGDSDDARTTLYHQGRAAEPSQRRQRAG
jgi:hypothetical protein